MPLIVAAAVMALVVVFLFLHPRFRRDAPVVWGGEALDAAEAAEVPVE